MKPKKLNSILNRNNGLVKDKPRKYEACIKDYTNELPDIFKERLNEKLKAHKLTIVSKAQHDDLDVERHKLQRAEKVEERVSALEKVITCFNKQDEKERPKLASKFIKQGVA